MLYIMHRTQIYLDERLWETLKVKARLEGTTISELMRIAGNRMYLDSHARRSEAMKNFVGIRANRPDFGDPDFDTEAYIRNLRQSPRRKKALGY